MKPCEECVFYKSPNCLKVSPTEAEILMCHYSEEDRNIDTEELLSLAELQNYSY
ncbi:MAG: hypothetical protein ACRC0F_03185 [Cetobacterium sp.]